MKNIQSDYAEPMSSISVIMKWQPPGLMTYISDKFSFPKFQDFLFLFITREPHDSFNYYLKIMKKEEYKLLKKEKIIPHGNL